MVLSARNSGGSIRPVLGPVFVAPQYAGIPETIEVEETVTSPGRPKPVATQDAGTPRVIERPRPEVGAPPSTILPYRI